MPLTDHQILLGEILLAELSPAVARELNWLLRITSAPKGKRTSLYEQWEGESQPIPIPGNDRSYAVSRILMDIYHQGRVGDLLASLQQLIAQKIRPTIQEFSEMILELRKRPWRLSLKELEIIRHLHEHPTASAAQIARITGFHRKTVASHMRRLFFALQILPYPLINYHAIGLRRFQFWFRGSMKIPSSVYFYSRISLMSRGLEGSWLMDTWSVPTGHEQLLLDCYHQPESTGQIQDVTVRELYSTGKHLSLASYKEGLGWESDPDVIKLTMQRALEGQESFNPQFLEQMVYDSRRVLRLDGVDMHIIGALLDDYLLGQSQESLSLKLGISRSNFRRRLRRMEKHGVIKSSLWLKTENMVPTVLKISMAEPQLLNALMCLPVVYFSIMESKDTGQREWLVTAKSSPAAADVIAKACRPDGNPLASYGAHFVENRLLQHLFESYDVEQNCWPPELLLPK
ncbi:MAG: helix-turn-helix transcriptional regulator [Candidatus Heimdallarchaeota archaeon]